MTKSRDYILARVMQRILDMYGDDQEQCPKHAEGRELFVQRAYSNWAAWEYYFCLRRASDIFLASEYFVKQMDTFACSDHPDTRMFAVAYDVATDLNDFLMTV